MSKMKNRACGGTQDAAVSEIAGRDAGILNTAQPATQSTAGINTAAAIKFITTMFAASETARVFIGSRPNDAAEDIDSPYEKRFINKPSTAAELPEFLTTWDRPGRAMYFCVGILQDTATKRRKEFIKESVCLHADIDLKNVDIDSRDDVLRKLRSMRCPPSIIVASGHGFHTYWLFKEPVLSDEMERVESALKLLADLVCGDREPTHIAAFLRLPGSHNTKNGEWREVEIIEDNGNRYELDDLEEWLEETSPIILRMGRQPYKSLGETDVWAEYVKRLGRKSPVDVEKRLAAMTYMGGGDAAIHTTQLSVTASLLNAGQPIDEVVAIVLEATHGAAGGYGNRWNWKREERRIREMSETWQKKREKENAKASVSLSSASPPPPSSSVVAPANSEESLALIFADRHESDLRFVAKWGQWLRWDATRWALEETLHAFDMSRVVCREAANASNKVSNAKTLASAKTVAAVERLAKADRRLAATFEQWDIHPDKFNTTED
jgi:hypothetical protein